MIRTILFLYPTVKTSEYIVVTETTHHESRFSFPVCSIVSAVCSMCREIFERLHGVQERPHGVQEGLHGVQGALSLTSG